MSVVGIPHRIGGHQAADPVLDAGAIGIDTVSGAIKKGDGTTAFSALTAINANGIALVSAPASAGATGTAGSIAYDSTHIYVCVATNTWVRASLATW